MAPKIHHSEGVREANTQIFGPLLSSGKNQELSASFIFWPQYLRPGPPFFYKSSNSFNLPLTSANITAKISASCHCRLLYLKCVPCHLHTVWYTHFRNRLSHQTASLQTGLGSSSISWSHVGGFYGTRSQIRPQHCSPCSNEASFNEKVFLTPCLFYGLVVFSHILMLICGTVLWQ